MDKIWFHMTNYLTLYIDDDNAEVVPNDYDVYGFETYFIPRVLGVRFTRTPGNPEGNLEELENIVYDH